MEESIAYSSGPSSADWKQRLAELWQCTTNKPVRHLRSERLELFAKLEYGGFSGSVKDRAALRMVEGAMLRGEIVPDTVLVESSSGNLAIALGSICRFLGLRFVAVIDPLVNQTTEARLQRLCFEVIKVKERDPTGGFLLNRRRSVFEQRSRFDHVYFPNQYDNPDNYLAYYDTLGLELYHQVPCLDYVFIAVSSGGTITGVSRRLKELSPETQIIGVDVQGSVIFGGKPRRRHVTGLGSSLVPGILNDAEFDEYMLLSEVDIVEGCHDLLREQSLFAGASSGACYAAVHQYFQHCPPKRARPRVAFICPDSGDGYTSTVYDVKWIEMLQSELTTEREPSSRAQPFSRKHVLGAPATEKQGEDVRHALSR